MSNQMSIIEALQRATTAPRPTTTIDINVEPSEREKRPVGRPRKNDASYDPRPSPAEADAPSQAKRKREIVAQRAAVGAEIIAEEGKKEGRRVLKGKVKIVFSQWVTNAHINSGTDSQDLNSLLMRTNKDSKEQLFDWVHQGWSDTDTVIRGWLEAGLLEAFNVEAQDEASKLFEEGLLFPAKKEGRGFEMTAVPTGTDAALGASNDDEIVYEDDYGAEDNDADFEIIDDDDEEEEDLIAMMEDLCRGDSGGDDDGDCDSAHEDDVCLPRYAPKARGEGKRTSQVPKKLLH
ncbi:hypothetical protein Ndes2526A_g03933 [Nannochloris sp. 'desiccata']